MYLYLFGGYILNTPTFKYTIQYEYVFILLLSSDRGDFVYIPNIVSMFYLCSIEMT